MFNLCNVAFRDELQEQIKTNAIASSLSSDFSRKLLVRLLYVPLTNLFNYSLQHTVVPLAWKRSHITPVFKGDAPNDPSNY